jgi:hypothetical protein
VDQVNVIIPRSLAGRNGAADLTLTVDGKVANTLSLSIKQAAAGTRHSEMAAMKKWFLIAATEQQWLGFRGTMTLYLNAS